MRLSIGQSHQQTGCALRLQHPQHVGTKEPLLQFARGQALQVREKIAFELVSISRAPVEHQRVALNNARESLIPGPGIGRLLLTCAQDIHHEDGAVHPDMGALCRLLHRAHRLAAKTKIGQRAGHRLQVRKLEFLRPLLGRLPIIAKQTEDAQTQVLLAVTRRCHHVDLISLEVLVPGNSTQHGGIEHARVESQGSTEHPAAPSGPIRSDHLQDLLAAEAGEVALQSPKRLGPGPIPGSARIVRQMVYQESEQLFAVAGGGLGRLQEVHQQIGQEGLVAQ